MECNQQHMTVAATKTLYENFLEEKCESDFVIPDYYPAAEKIIQCCAVPVITRKDVEGDRLNIEGVCRFTILYMGEDEIEIKALNETVEFSESLPVKEVAEEPWVIASVRASATSCRLLNPRKISAKSTVSVALRVKYCAEVNAIEALNCAEAETLFVPATVYTALEHPVDTTKVQGELEVHTEILNVLKTDGTVCLKDIKLMAGKAIIKGILNLYVLFAPSEDPCRIESTSTAIPFSQMIELRSMNENMLMEACASIQNIRADVDSNADGKNCIISVVATIQTEGEVYENRRRMLLTEAYSNHYTIEIERGQIETEELTERFEMTEFLHHHLSSDGDDCEVIQAVGYPLIQKVVGQEDALVISGVLDLSVFLREGNAYRSVDKSVPFSLKKEMKSLGGRMRCEVHPCVIGIDWSAVDGGIEIKTELSCSMMIFTKRSFDVISGVSLDVEHPVKCEIQHPLVVYYAEKGERLWDIAKKYATSVSVIKEVNELEDDVLESKKLLLIAR